MTKEVNRPLRSDKPMGLKKLNMLLCLSSVKFNFAHM